MHPFVRARAAKALGIALVVGSLVGLTAGPVPAAVSNDEPDGAQAATVDVQLLATNDFHGNLEPPAGSSGRIGTISAGGAQYLATHIAALEATNPNTLVVAAGDIIGASPLLSALFHDEPTIEAMNEMSLDIASVGNHEFDEGYQELLRMQDGGCHPVDGCQDGDDFGGADFQFLAANVVRNKNGKAILPPVAIRGFGGVKVGFIGMTLEGTPSIVTPSGIQGLDFLDEVETIDRWVPYLKSKGAEAIVVLIHEGGLPTGGFNECPGISGPIVDIVNHSDDEVDVFITGHTHQAYNCSIDGRIVTSAASFGRLVTDVDMTIDMSSGEVVSAAANNVIVTRDVALDDAITALIEKYSFFADPLANRVIGAITADITRLNNPAGESALGDVIADAQLAATASPETGGAVVAFMNPGGIRADLTFSQISGGEAPGEITYEEAFTVQPFGNNLTTMTLTGAQIETLLEQQWTAPQPTGGRILQVSEGFMYTWDNAAPIGDRVDPTTIKIDGVTVDPSATYRVTVNSFLASGGDNFTVLTQGADVLGGAVDTDALEAYFAANSPVGPGPQNRITRIN
jgi:5'-nucleotidase